jgi:hypothetical protein
MVGWASFWQTIRMSSQRFSFRLSRFSRAGFRTAAALLFASVSALSAGTIVSTWSGSGSWSDYQGLHWANTPSLGYAYFPNNDATNTFDVKVPGNNAYLDVSTPFSDGGTTYNFFAVNSLTISGTSAVVYQSLGPSNSTDLRITGALTVSGGTFELAGGTLTAGSINLPGGTLKLSGGTLVPTTVTLAGGTVIGGTFPLSGPGQLVITSGINTLDGTQVVGSLAYPQDNARLKLRNDAAIVGGGVTLGKTGNYLHFEATTADHDAVVSSAINLDGISPSVVLEGPSMSVSLTPAATLRGRGVVYNGGSYLGVFTLANQGTISADLSGQTLALNVPVFDNKPGGMIRALNGGVLTISPGTAFTNQAGATLSITGGSSATLQTNWHNAGTLVLADTSVLTLAGTATFADLGVAGWQRTGGTVNLQGTLDLQSQTCALDANTGSLNFNGGTLKNGTLNTTASARLLFNNNGSNLLDGVTCQGDALFDQNSGRVRLRNDATFTGNVTLAQAGTLLAFEGSATDSTATFATTLNMDAPSSRISLEGVAPSLTLAPGAAVRGAGLLTLGTLGGVSGLAEVINQGNVVADIPGQTLTLSPLQFTNQAGSSVCAVNGGILVINPGTSFNSPVSSFDNLSAGIISAIGGSTITLQRNWHNQGDVILRDTSVLNLQGTFTTADLGAAGWARQGGTVNLQGILTNTGSTLPLASIGSVVVSGGTILGGIVAPTATERLIFSNNSGNILDGVTHSGNLLLDQNSHRVQLRNDATFAGYSATLSGASDILSFAATTLDATALLTQATVNLDGTNDNFSLDGPSPVLTVSPSGVIRGRGAINQGFGGGYSGVPTLINQGLVSADLAGQTLDCTVSSIVNTGVLEVKNGATLRLTSAHATQAAGVFRLGGGILQITTNTAGADMSVGASARLEGYGEVRLISASTDSLAVAGTLDPGFGAGGLVIKGDLAPAASGTLAFDLAGPTQGTGYDFVSEAGGTPLNLNGCALQLTLAPGYAPGAAQTFTVLTSTQTITGAFGNVASGARLITADGRGSFVVTYTGSSSVVLSAFQATPQAAFLNWIAQAFPGVTNAAIVGPKADPDGDGVPNWMEFALKGNPASTSASGLTAALMQDVDPLPGTEFTYVLACRAGAHFSTQPSGAQGTDGPVDAVSYVVEGSADLQTYPLTVLHQGQSFTPPTGVGLPDLTGTGWEYHTFYVDPKQAGARVFLRLRADFFP